MKILVLGGGGFIGSSLVDKLLSKGHSVRVFERFNTKKFREFDNAEEIEWVEGDITSCSVIENALLDVDHVFHLVSTTVPNTSCSNEIYDVESNLVTTILIIQSMVKLGVLNITFLSSGGTVYGDPLYLPINESHPTNPNVSYGIIKLAIEKYMLLYKKNHNLNPIILRLSNPYGKRQSSLNQGVVGVFIRNIISDKPIKIIGDGSMSRDYIYITDVVEAMYKTIFYKGSHSIFNIGSGFQTSINDLVSILRKAANIDFKVEHLPNRLFDIQLNCLDIELAKKELNWEPTVPILDGIVKTLEWTKMNLANVIKN